MFWLITHRPIRGPHSVDPWGNVWSRSYRGSKGALRAMPRRLVPCDNGKGYQVVNLLGRAYLVHGLVAAAFLPPQPQGTSVDHRNRIRVDNAASNLRWATREENNRNVSRSKNCRSRFLGVCKEKRTSRFVASLMVAGRKFSRSFRSETAAALYRDLLVQQHHGEYGSLNFDPHMSRLFYMVEVFSTAR